jgi:hypothetical protein
MNGQKGTNRNNKQLPARSFVKLALGYSRELASSSLRLTLGLHTTSEEIDYTVGVLRDLIGSLSQSEPALALRAIASKDSRYLPHPQSLSVYREGLPKGVL